MKIKQYLLNEKIFDMSGIVGDRKVALPVIAKDANGAKKEFKRKVLQQIKFGHLSNGEIRNIKVEHEL